MFKLASFATVAAASALALAASGTLAAPPLLAAGSSSPDVTDTTLVADAAAISPAVTVTPAAEAAPATSSSGSRTTSMQTASIGTKHGLKGSVTFSHRPDGGGQLRISGAGLPAEDPLTIAVYGGTATPVSTGRMLLSWTRDDMTRKADGSLVIDLTESQVAALHDARAEGGVLVRVSDGTTFGEAIYAAK